MKNEKPNARSLEDKLKDLLEPSTYQYTLDSLRAANTSVLPAHLRLRQKELDKKERLVDAATGVVHNGAHFPLFMVTRNSGHRSEEAHAARRNKNGHTGISRGFCGMRQRQMPTKTRP